MKTKKDQKQQLTSPPTAAANAKATVATQERQFSTESITLTRAKDPDVTSAPSFACAAGEGVCSLNPPPPIPDEGDGVSVLTPTAGATGLLVTPEGAGVVRPDAAGLDVAPACCTGALVAEGVEIVKGGSVAGGP